MQKNKEPKNLSCIKQLNKKTKQDTYTFTDLIFIEIMDVFNDNL